MEFGQPVMNVSDGYYITFPGETKEKKIFYVKIIARICYRRGRGIIFLHICVILEFFSLLARFRSILLRKSTSARFQFSTSPMQNNKISPTKKCRPLKKKNNMQKRNMELLSSPDRKFERKKKREKKKETQEEPISKSESPKFKRPLLKGQNLHLYTLTFHSWILKEE